MPSVFTLEGPQLNLPGGRSDGIPFTAFDQTQLAIGARVEMEHTNDPQIAMRIAADHLTEDPLYYQKLAKVHLDGAMLGRSWLKWLAIGTSVVGVVLAGRWTYRNRRMIKRYAKAMASAE